ncbi:two-component system, cell cycle sensor histidine kinase PleC [uncultured Gammaproteobacteria bacterium]
MPCPGQAGSTLALIAARTSLGHATAFVVDGGAFGISNRAAIGLLVRGNGDGGSAEAVFVLTGMAHLLHFPAEDWPGTSLIQVVLNDSGPGGVGRTVITESVETEAERLPLLASSNAEMVDRARLGDQELEISARLPRGDQPWLLSLLPIVVLIAGGLFSMVALISGRVAKHQARQVASLAASLQQANDELVRRMAERDHIADALRDSERKYRGIYENAVEGIIQAGPDGRILSANPALARMFGCTDPDDFLATYNAPGRRLFTDPVRWDQFRAELLLHGEVRAFEAEAERKNGSRLWIEQNGRAVVDDGGRVKHYEGLVSDATERRAAEEALRLAKEQSEMLARAKSEFMANVSHELRTPLNAIIGFSGMIKDQLFGPIGRREYVEFARDVYDSGALLLTMINDILDMARIEAGKKELDEVLLDLGEVVQASLALVRGRATDGHVTLTATIPAHLPPIRAEERSLKQILSNLLSNAIKFTGRDGRVTLALRQEADGRILIKIADTGIGIAREDMAKVLMPFGQAAAGLNNKSEGTGLGLPLVRSLIALHGGSFHIESQIGVGTTVFVWLPAERVIRRVA